MTKYLLEIMLEEGMPPEKTQEVSQQLDDALKNDTIRFIKKDGVTIGFLTYYPEDGKIFINNCVIFKSFRNSANFLYLRKIFRRQFKGMQFTWESKKRNDKMVYVR